MKTLRLRAVVLAAGQGFRLRPLTDFVPKPLVPVRGQSVVARTIEELARAGCEAVAVNLFHQGDTIRKALGAEQSGVPITYSQETELLGTLGALWPLRKFLQSAELVVVVNGDSLCHWPIKKLVRRHVRSGATSTLLVSRRIDPQPFGGGITIDKRGQVVSMSSRVVADANGQRKDLRRRLFMGAHVFSPEHLTRIQQGPSNFVPDLYEPLIAEGKVLGTLATRRAWHDLGTPARYLRGVLSWGRRKGWVSPEAASAGAKRISKSVVERDVLIEKGSEIIESLIFAGARIGPGCRIAESIIGPGVELPANTSVEGRVVTTVKEGDDEAATSPVVVGGLEYKEM